MDFTLNDEQRMLHETVTRLVRDTYGFEQRAALLKGDAPYSAGVWSTMAELGLLAVPFAEEDGGFAGGGVELMILHEAFGSGLTLEPYLASVVLGGGVVARLGSAEQRESLLAGVIAGETRLALAYAEAEGRYDPHWVDTRATKATSGDGYSLSGAKTVVLHGGSATRLVVSARTGGQITDAAGLSLFLVDPAQSGVTVRDYGTIDGLRAAEITFEGASATLLGREGEGAEALDAVLALGATALCAEAVGAMTQACDLTLDYLKVRQQFGGPIGRFQALQHRMVDMRIGLEQVRSATILAAASHGLPAAERDRRISAAKALVGITGRKVAEEAIQLHGGIGMTDEAAVSHYAKRLVMIDHWLGDSDYHLARYIALPRAAAEWEVEAAA